MLKILLYLGLSSWLAVSLPAGAQDAPSRQQIAAGNELLQAGKAAYSGGHFAEALYDFEQAYRRLERTSILYRIGDTADKLGNHDRAVSALRQYLEAEPQAGDREFIESRIAANLEALSVAAPGALSPEAAAASSGAGKAAAAPQDATRSGHNRAGPWWAWAGAGTLVVVGIVVVAALVGAGSPHEQAPVKGNIGGVVQTLGAP
jgi:tetratricopeptide (TPR) repeat protein